MKNAERHSLRPVEDGHRHGQQGGIPVESRESVDGRDLQNEQQRHDKIGRLSI